MSKICMSELCLVDLLIEPDHNWNSEQLAVVAPCLVDVTRRCAVNVRILNPTTNPISVKQDQVLGRAETISDELLTLFESEDPRGNQFVSHPPDWAGERS